MICCKTEFHQGKMVRRSEKDLKKSCVSHLNSILQSLWGRDQPGLDVCIVLNTAGYLPPDAINIQG